MPTNPHACRTRAKSCRHLAGHSADLRAKLILLDLATTWEQIASECEDSTAFLDTMREIEEEDRAANGGSH